MKGMMQIFEEEIKVANEQEHFSFSLFRGIVINRYLNEYNSPMSFDQAKKIFDQLMKKKKYRNLLPIYSRKVPEAKSQEEIAKISKLVARVIFVSLMILCSTIFIILIGCTLSVPVLVQLAVIILFAIMIVFNYISLFQV